MSVQGLSAEVTADASDYLATIEIAQEQTEDFGDEATRVSRKMQLLQSRVDEAGDEMTEMAGKATVAGTALNSLNIPSEITGSSLLNLSTTLTGSLVPGLLAGTAAAAALSAAIVSVGAAVASLAGTFGLLLGAGFVTRMESLKETFKDVIPQIKAALAPLGQVFGPLLQTAIQSLPQLTRNIVQAIGGVSEFRRTLSQLGQQLFRILPSLVAGMVDFARVALPAMREFLSIIGDGSGFAFIQRIFQRIGDDVGRIARATASLLPPFLKLGGILIELLAPATATFLTTLSKSAQILTVLASALRPLFPLITGLSTIIGELFEKTLDGVLNSLKGIVNLLQGDIPAAMQNFRDVIKKSAIPIGKLLIQALAAVGRGVINLVQSLTETLVNGIITTINKHVLPAVNSLIARINQLPAMNLQFATSLSTVDIAGQQAARRRSEARRGNPSARGGLPPIEVRADTGVVEDVAFAAGEEGGQRAVRGATRRKRRQRQRSDRR